MHALCLNPVNIIYHNTYMYINMYSMYRNLWTENLKILQLTVTKLSSYYLMPRQNYNITKYVHNVGYTEADYWKLS